MSYKVMSTDLAKLKLLEDETVQAVLQNIAVILATPKGSVPMYRDFGLDTSFLDMPIPVAKVRMIAEVREAVETWEPRATVVGVSFTDDQAASGTLIPVVEVEIHE